MLTHAQEKLIRSLHTSKGRKESGLCLVEGEKVIQTASHAVDFSFSRSDTKLFDKLVTTTSPQSVAAVARIPQWSMTDIAHKPTIIVLDGVQDPGNVGAIFRLCLGFNAAAILVDSADPSNPKTVRSSVGALFQVPWMTTPRSGVEELLKSLGRPVYRLELRPESITGTHSSISTLPRDIVLIIGSEGTGITLSTSGISVAIPHEHRLESLNVGHALAIFLSSRYQALA